MKRAIVLMLFAGLVSCTSTKEEAPDMTNAIERVINEQTERELLSL